jgi:hypothetical protein
MKRAMARAARVMAMVMKRAMATNGNTTDNGYGKEDDGCLTAATRGMAPRAQLLALQLKRGGCWWQ